MEGSRGDLKEVIVEDYINFDYEITLLTLTQNNGNTLFLSSNRTQTRERRLSRKLPMTMEDVHLKNGTRNG